ncbi:MAG: tripartite tricarboxylate transporter TctB family protein [Candidatus Rokuibacteriota bacterium]
MTPEVRREMGIGGVLVALGSAVVAVAMTIPPGVQTDPLGPRVFPAALGAGIAVCGVLLGLGALARPGDPGRVAAFGEPLPEEPAAPFSPWRLAGAIVVTGAYLVAFEPLGYLLATPAYVAAILAVHGGGSRTAWLAAPPLVTVALYAAFRFGLGIPVPVGILEPVLPW